VNATAPTEIVPAAWALGVSDAGHGNLMWVAASVLPGTALRRGRLVAEAVTATASGQRPADADTLSAGHDTEVGHTTSRSWPR
jgi:hypothetical protein